MQPKFNTDRPKVSDEEINKHKDFDKLVKQFKEQSLQKAKSDKSWWNQKSIKYSTIIAGVTVVCTVTYFALFNKSNSATKSTAKKTENTQNTASSTSKNQAFIQSPLPTINIPYSSYKTSNVKSTEISHPSGSKIKIPQNAFVNKKGEAITGEIEILYREFHDQGDIIASGIPMYYDSAGIKSVFESAGMFDIRGVQNGEPVFINPTAPLTIEFASKNNRDEFNQYYLDTIARNWQYLQRDNLIMPKTTLSNNDVKSAEKAVDSKYQKAIAAIPPKIDSVKKVYTQKINKLEKPTQPVKPNKSAGRPQFELDVDYKEFPELSAFKNAMFEIGEENTGFSKDLSRITWNSAEISEGPQKGKNYWLTLKQKNRTEKLVVYPVLTGADYEQAAKKYEEKFEKYKGLLAKREANEQKLKAELEAKQAEFIAKQKKLEEEYLKERNRIKQQMTTSINTQMQAGGVNNSLLNRVFNISNFGIFNSDRPIPIPPMEKTINPMFVENGGKTISPHILYVIETNRNVVFSYNELTMNNIVLNQRLNYSMCIIAGNKTYVVNQNEIQEVLKAGGNKFNATSLSREINDIYELKKAIGLI